MLFFLQNLEACLRWGLRWGMILGFSMASSLYLLQLVLRLLAQSTISGIDWYIQYGFVVSALLGAAYGVKTNENIKIELFRILARHRLVQRLNNLIAVIITLLILWVFYSYTLQTMGGGYKNVFITIPYFYLFLVTLISYLIRLFYLDAIKD